MISSMFDVAWILLVTACSCFYAGVARVFLVSKEGTAEERIVTTGQTVDGQIELTSGIKAGDTVATSNVDRIADGVRITRGP
jgi:multidrug efflux pump subunit AcrA (membrane-fusion protein)